MSTVKDRAKAPEGTVYWSDGIARLIEARREYAKSATRLADMNLGKWEDTAEAAARRFNDAKAKFGKKSGHKLCQQAEGALKKAQRERSHWARTAKRSRELLDTIDAEKEELTTLVRVFLSGDSCRSECGTIRLSVTKNGDLNIFFNKDGSPIKGHQPDGHFVVKPDGYMASMRLR